MDKFAKGNNLKNNFLTKKSPCDLLIILYQLTKFDEVPAIIVFETLNTKFHFSPLKRE